MKTEYFLPLVAVYPNGPKKYADRANLNAVELSEKGQKSQLKILIKEIYMGSKRFEVREQQHISGGIVKIIVDTKTGVNYLVTSGMGISGMTPSFSNLPLRNSN